MASTARLGLAKTSWRSCRDVAKISKFGQPKLTKMFWPPRSRNVAEDLIKILESWKLAKKEMERNWKIS